MDDDKIQYSSENYAPEQRVQKRGGLSSLMMRLGLAKDEKQAGTVLMILVIVCIVVGVGVWFVV